ncbi:MAG: hypothetical protein DI551_11965, partial [Micavibrio aeruginosavorus]
KHPVANNMQRVDFCFSEPVAWKDVIHLIQDACDTELARAELDPKQHDYTLSWSGEYKFFDLLPRERPSPEM